MNNLDSLSIFISQLEKYPLLTDEQEVVLARRVQAGDEEAKDLFINSNLRLVVQIAKRYQMPGVSINDLIQEGSIGLQRAVEKFNPEMGNKFSTYAVPWINQAVNRGRMKSARTIRLPYDQTQRLTKMRKEVDALSSRLGRAATMQEIADHYGKSISDIKDDFVNMSPISSLNQTFEEDKEYMSNLTSTDNVVEESINNSQAGAVNSIMSKALTDRECMVIQMRYGLGKYKEMSLEEIGKHFNLTRERIRQIENSAKIKMKTVMEREAASAEKVL